MRNLIVFIKKAAKTDVNVLSLGETGVGKGLAARMIHLYSARKDKSFIKVNCANLKESLLESELFGYKKGAYTGAMIDKPGLLEAAKGGTFSIPVYIYPCLVLFKYLLGLFSTQPKKC